MIFHRYETSSSSFEILSTSTEMPWGEIKEKQEKENSLKIFYLLSLADVFPSKSLNSKRAFLKERQWKIFKTKQLFMDFLPPHSDWPHLLRQLLSPYGRQCSYQQEDAKESTNKQTVQIYLFTTIQYIICTFSFLI